MSYLTTTESLLEHKINHLLKLSKSDSPKEKDADIDRQSNRKIDRQTDTEMKSYFHFRTDRPTDRQTEWQTDKQISRHTKRHRDRQTYEEMVLTCHHFYPQVHHISLLSSSQAGIQFYLEKKKKNVKNTNFNVNSIWTPSIKIVSLFAWVCMHCGHMWSSGTVRQWVQVPLQLTWACLWARYLVPIASSTQVMYKHR